MKTVWVNNKPFSFSNGVFIMNHPQISGVASLSHILASAPEVKHPGLCTQSAWGSIRPTSYVLVMSIF